MKRLSILLLISLSLIPKPSHSELVTGIAVTQAIGQGAQLLKKRPPATAVVVALQNRELIISMHTRLELVEDGIIQILKEIAKFPQEVYEANLQADFKGISAKSLSRAELFFRKAEFSLRDLDTFGPNSEIFLRLEKERKTAMRTLLDQITQELYVMDSYRLSRSAGALGAAAATHLQLAMMLHYEDRYELSPSEILLAAETGVERMDDILDQRNPSSLSSVIAERQARIHSDLARISKGQWNIPLPADPKNLDPRELVGSYKGTCLAKEGYKHFLEDGILYGYIGITHRQETTLRLKAANSDQLNAPIEFDINYGAWEPSEEQSGWNDTDNFGCLVVGPAPNARPDVGLHLRDIAHNSTNGRYQALWADSDYNWEAQEPANRVHSTQVSQIDTIIPELNMLTNLLVIREGVESTRDFSLSVLAGDAITFPKNINSVVMPLRDQDIFYLINDAKRLVKLHEIEEFEDTILARRENVSRLIKSQNDELSKVFSEAAKAAKRNSTLSYIQGIAMLIQKGINNYDTWSTSEQEKYFDQIDAAKKAGDILQSREPAMALTKLAIDYLPDVLQQKVSWSNLRIQMERMDAARESIILKHLAPGEEGFFDLWVRGNEFEAWTKAGQRQIFRGGQPPASKFGTYRLMRPKPLNQ